MGILLTALYLLALVPALPGVAIMLLFQPRRRAGLKQKLGFLPRRTGEKPALWVHAVSVGEANAVLTLIPALRARWPEYEVVVSVTTKTGMAAARKNYPDLMVFYYPFDFAWSVSAAFRRIRPAAVLLVEQEVWPVFVRTAARRGVPVAVVNGRITEKAFRGYRRFAFVMRGAFRRVAFFAMQTEEYAGRIRALGVAPERVHVAGSLKYDAVPTEVDAAVVERYRRLFRLGPQDPVLLAASTHAGEDEVLLEVHLALRERFPALRLVLVPRHPERFEAVAALVEKTGRPWLRRSAVAEGAGVRVQGSAQGGQGSRAGGQESAIRHPQSAIAGEIPSPEIVLVDTMGELTALLGVADVVFVGGSLVPFGGHNMMDPAGLGKPVVLGPHTWNFSETVEALVAAAGAAEVSDAAALKKTIERWLADPAAAAEVGRRGRQAVLDRRGATERTVRLIEDALPFGSRLNVAEG